MQLQASVTSVQLPFKTGKLRIVLRLLAPIVNNIRFDTSDILVTVVEITPDPPEENTEEKQSRLARLSRYSPAIQFVSHSLFNPRLGILFTVNRDECCALSLLLSHPLFLNLPYSKFYSFYSFHSTLNSTLLSPPPYNVIFIRAFDSAAGRYVDAKGFHAFRVSFTVSISLSRTLFTRLTRSREHSFLRVLLTARSSRSPPERDILRNPHVKICHAALFERARPWFGTVRIA